MRPTCDVEPCPAWAVRKLIWKADPATPMPVCQSHANAAKRVYGELVLVMYL